MDSHLNFVRASDQNPVLTVTFHPIGAWEMQKRGIEKELGPKLKPITGLGDDAYDLDGSVVFRKGRYAVQLVSGADFGGGKLKPFLTPRQVEDLARLIASRL